MATDTAAADAFIARSAGFDEFVRAPGRLCGWSDADAGKGYALMQPVFPESAPCRFLLGGNGSWTGEMRRRLTAKARLIGAQIEYVSRHRS